MRTQRVYDEGVYSYIRKASCTWRCPHYAQKRTSGLAFSASALALFGRRPPVPGDSFVIPASENLHNSGSRAPGRNTAPRPSDQRKLNRNSQDSCRSAYPCGLVHYPHALRQPSFHVTRSAMARNTLTEWAGTGRNGHCSSNRMLGTTQSAKAVLHRASRPSGSAHRCARRHHKGHGESLVRKSPVLGH